MILYRLKSQSNSPYLSLSSVLQFMTNNRQQQCPNRHQDGLKSKSIRPGSLIQLHTNGREVHPCLRFSQSQQQVREQKIPPLPANPVQLSTVPPEHSLQSRQHYSILETHHGQPYVYPSPQQHPMSVNYATQPSSFAAPQYYPQQYMVPPQ